MTDDEKITDIEAYREAKDDADWMHSLMQKLSDGEPVTQKKKLFEQLYRDNLLRRDDDDDSDDVWLYT